MLEKPRAKATDCRGGGWRDLDGAFLSENYAIWETFPSQPEISDFTICQVHDPLIYTGV